MKLYYDKRLKYPTKYIHQVFINGKKTKKKKPPQTKTRQRQTLKLKKPLQKKRPQRQMIFSVS